MSGELRPGEVLASVYAGREARVERLLGEGGQGWVYQVAFDGRPYALKWYTPAMIAADPNLWGRLRKAVDRGAPSDRFLWPFELVTRAREPRDPGQFGYLMRLRGEAFSKATSVIAGEQHASYRAIASACFQLAEAFSALHGKGLSYQDISAGNVFIDAASGDIQICDNDNVDIDGTLTAIGGTAGYQPPELVLRQTYPSRKTDLHALAVLLFELLHGGHPLRGGRESAFSNFNDDAKRSLYGLAPRFVFDPSDASNRPLAELHGPVIAQWAIYPQALRDLFVRAFTVGLVDADHGRVVEAEWRTAMAALLDAISVCPQCGAENFYDGKRLAAKQRTYRCWNERCGAELASNPLRIGIRRPGARAGELPAHVVVLAPSTKLYSHHTAGGEFDFRRPTGEVSAGEPRLRNLGAKPWRITLGDTTNELAPGEAMPLASGMRIAFERTEGEVKA